MYLNIRTSTCPLARCKVGISSSSSSSRNGLHHANAYATICNVYSLARSAKEAGGVFFVFVVVAFLIHSREKNRRGQGRGVLALNQPVLI